MARLLVGKLISQRLTTNRFIIDRQIMGLLALTITPVLLCSSLTAVADYVSIGRQG